MSVSTANTSSNATFSVEEKKWIDLLNDAYIGDVGACLAITTALKQSKEKVRCVCTAMCLFAWYTCDSNKELA